MEKYNPELMYNYNTLAPPLQGAKVIAYFESGLLSIANYISCHTLAVTDMETLNVITETDKGLSG